MLSSCVSFIFNFLLFQFYLSYIMPSVLSVVAKYQDLLRPHVPFNFSSRRLVFGSVGIPNSLFIFTMGCHKEHFHSFLRELGLIKNELNCPKCKSKMKIKPEKNRTDGCVWICRHYTSGKKCGCARSIRHGTLFNYSRLTMEEILLLTYELVRGTESKYLFREYSFNEHTVVEWRYLVREIMLSFIKAKSEKIGGVGNVVEVYQSKFEKRKFYKEDAVIESQCVIGGIERETGKLFLVPVQDESQNMLDGIIEEWIEKGTTILPDSMVYKVLGEEGFDQLTLNHSITFVDPSKSKLRQVKSGFFLAQLMFEKSCVWKTEDPFNKFLEVVSETSWDEFVVTLDKSKKTQKRKISDCDSTLQ